MERIKHTLVLALLVAIAAAASVFLAGGWALADDPPPGKTLPPPELLGPGPAGPGGPEDDPPLSNSPIVADSALVVCWTDFFGGSLQTHVDSFSFPDGTTGVVRSSVHTRFGGGVGYLYQVEVTGGPGDVSDLHVPFLAPIVTTFGMTSYRLLLCASGLCSSGFGTYNDPFFSPNPVDPIYPAGSVNPTSSFITDLAGGIYSTDWPAMGVGVRTHPFGVATSETTFTLVTALVTRPDGSTAPVVVKAPGAAAKAVVKKVMVGGTDTFKYFGTPSGSIAASGGTISAPGLEPGTYFSFEQKPPGWDLTDITCDDTDSVGNVFFHTAIFNLEPGETVTCTFTNKKRDHYLAYKVDTRRGAFKPRTVHLVDQFEAETQDEFRLFRVLRPVALYNPVDKNQEGIADRETHLVAYVIKRLTGRSLPVKGVLVQDQFGSLVVDVGRPDLLLVPSTKSLEGPAAVDKGIFQGDRHFKCYRVKAEPFEPRKVFLQDQFQDKEMLAVKPARLCAPVEKIQADDQGRLDFGTAAGKPLLQTHLMCYEVKEQTKRKLFANVGDQFQPLSLKVDLERELCVPALKELPHQET